MLYNLFLPPRGVCRENSGKISLRFFCTIYGIKNFNIKKFQQKRLLIFCFFFHFSYQFSTKNFQKVFQLAHFTTFFAVFFFRSDLSIKLRRKKTTHL